MVRALLAAAVKLHPSTSAIWPMCWQAITIWCHSLPLPALSRQVGDFCPSCFHGAFAATGFDVLHCVIPDRKVQGAFQIMAVVAEIRQRVIFFLQQ